MHTITSNGRQNAQKQATTAAQRLCGYFPQSPASDPQVFMVGLVQLLSNYPWNVLEGILSPLSGIPAKYKFLPSLAEIREECEDRMPPLPPIPEHQILNRDALMIEGPKIPKPTLAELKAKHGENWGLSAQVKPQGKPTPFRKLSDLIAEAGISQAEFDAQQERAREFLKR